MNGLQGQSVVLSQTHAVYVVCNPSIIQRSFGPESHKMCAAPIETYRRKDRNKYGKTFNIPIRISYYKLQNMGSCTHSFAAACKCSFL